MFLKYLFLFQFSGIESAIFNVINYGESFVSVNALLFVDEKEKKRLWEIFHYERMLDDNEQMLLADLQYYEERIRDISPASSVIEVSLLKNYMEHIKNTRALLLSLQNSRHETLKTQLQDVSTDSTSDF